MAEVYEHGTVTIENNKYHAIRFDSGIVHAYLSSKRRATRVSRLIARTFVRKADDA